MVRSGSHTNGRISFFLALMLISEISGTCKSKWALDTYPISIYFTTLSVNVALDDYIGTAPTVKPVLRGQSNRRPKLVSKTDYR